MRMEEQIVRCPRTALTGSAGILHVTAGMLPAALTESGVGAFRQRKAARTIKLVETVRQHAGHSGQHARAPPPERFTGARLLCEPNATLSFLMAAPLLFRNTKTRDVDLVKEFSHRSTQIFTALEERHSA